MTAPEYVVVEAKSANILGEFESAEGAHALIEEFSKWDPEASKRLEVLRLLENV